MGTHLYERERVARVDYVRAHRVQLCDTVPLVCAPAPSPSEYLFQLTAVLVHHGDMHTGHFVTFRRCPAPHPSQWLWASDDSVRKASLQEALSSNAYLVFYERVQRSSQALRPEA